ncbi:recombinase family protein [Lentibacillus populi]|nr:recombinase family protein [Lentibacillus populi]
MNHRWVVLDAYIFNFYVDVQTGTTSKRKNLQKMIEDAKAKKFDVILAKELSRLARNGELSYQIKNLCENQGIHIITLDNAINTLTGNTHMFGLYAWMYEQESQNTSNRVKESVKSRATKGLFRGSIPPYGYELRDGRLFIRNDETPSIVKRIYDEYLAGSGRVSIAKRLYNEGIRTPAQVSGRSNASDKWHDTTLRLILTNPHYVGDLVQAKTATVSVTNKKRKIQPKEEQIIIPNTHEAIIPRDVFDAVQHQVKLRKRYITAPKLHLFTNILFCSDCGSGLWYRANRQGYICGSYSRHGKKACSKHNIKESLLIDTIISDIKMLIEKINKENYIKELQSKTEKSKTKLQRKAEKYTKQIDVLKARKRKYIKLLADDQITQDDYLEIIESDNAELAMLVEKKSELLFSSESEQVFESIKKLKKELLQFLNFDELTPEMLHRLISRIEVKEDSTPVIHYRFNLPRFE